MSDDWAIFEPPDQAQLARHAEDLIHRANLVPQWRMGPVPARLVLRERSSGPPWSSATATSSSATVRRRSPRSSAGPSNCGDDRRPADTDAGLQRTRAWSGSIGSAR